MSNSNAKHNLLECCKLSILGRPSWASHAWCWTGRISQALTRRPLLGDRSICDPSSQTDLPTDWPASWSICDSSSQTDLPTCYEYVTVHTRSWVVDVGFVRPVCDPSSAVGRVRSVFDLLCCAGRLLGQRPPVSRSAWPGSACDLGQPEEGSTCHRWPGDCCHPVTGHLTTSGDRRQYDRLGGGRWHPPAQGDRCWGRQRRQDLPAARLQERQLSRRRPVCAHNVSVGSPTMNRSNRMCTPCTGVTTGRGLVPSSS